MPLVARRCRVRVGKVKKIDQLGHPMQKTWSILGYDTAWVPAHCGMVPSGLEEDCVFDPRRITVLRRVQVAAAAERAATKYARAKQKEKEKAAAKKARADAVRKGVASAAGVNSGHCKFVASSSSSPAAAKAGKADRARAGNAVENPRSLCA